MFHTQLPGATNDVRFDANSFTEANQVVTLDQTLQTCRTLDATGVMFNPKIEGLIYTDVLEVHGDLILPTTMQRDLKTIDMMGSGSHTISLNGVNAGGLSFIRLSGSGDYSLGSNFHAANLYIYCDGGSFNSMGYDIICSARVSTFLNYEVDVDFSGSNIDTGQWVLIGNSNFNLTNTTLTLGSALYLEINAPDVFHPVVYVNGVAGFTENFNCGTMEVAPGSEVQLNAGITLTADSFVLNGTNSGAISMHTNIAGDEATVFQTSGIVDGTYLVLTDIHATGGAVFNASESIDNGNNDGWNFLIDTEDNYYWVGGTGSWDDLSHWATTSGGSTYYSSLPDLNDFIIFDENSFSSEDDVVTIDGNLTVFSIDASATNVSALIRTNIGLGNTLTVLEDFSNGSARWDLSELTLVSDGEAFFETGDGNLMESLIYFSGTGTYNLIGDLTANRVIFESGSILSINNDFTLSNAFRVQGNASVNLTGSQINTHVFSTEAAVALNTSNSTIVVHGNMQNQGNHTYANVVFDGEVICGGTPSIAQLMITPGSTLSLYEDCVITVDVLNIEGTADNMITINGVNEGVHGTFFKTDGIVDAYFVNLVDNHATGGAEFNAHNSNDGGNTDGWNFITSVQEMNLSSLEVWPNPADGEVWVNTEAHQGQQLTLFDSVGRKVIETRITTTSSYLNVAALPAGLYVLTTNAGELTSRTVISIQ
jgi:hypothetical protein